MLVQTEMSRREHGFVVIYFHLLDEICSLDFFEILFDNSHFKGSKRDYFLHGNFGYV